MSSFVVLKISFLFSLSKQILNKKCLTLSEFQLTFIRDLSLPLPNGIYQIYHDDFRLYAKILQAVALFKPSSIPLVFSTLVENEQSCFLLCDNHMELVLRVEVHYDCTSEEEDDLIFDELRKSYCKNCIKHYLNKVCGIFPFENF